MSFFVWWFVTHLHSYCWWLMCTVKSVLWVKVLNWYYVIKCNPKSFMSLYVSGWSVYNDMNIRILRHTRMSKSWIYSWISRGEWKERSKRKKPCPKVNISVKCHMLTILCCCASQVRTPRKVNFHSTSRRHFLVSNQKLLLTNKLLYIVVIAHLDYL